MEKGNEGLSLVQNTCHDPGVYKSKLFVKQETENMRMLQYVCVCFVFSSHSFWTSSSLDVPAGVTQDFSSTFFLRCVP